MGIEQHLVAPAFCVEWNIVAQLASGVGLRARAVAEDVVTIQETLVGESLDAPRLINGMVEAFNGDPDHKCMGRSAPARLTRALEQAEQSGLTVASLKKIAQSQ